MRILTGEEGRIAQEIRSACEDAEKAYPDASPVVLSPDEYMVLKSILETRCQTLDDYKTGKLSLLLMSRADKDMEYVFSSELLSCLALDRTVCILKDNGKPACYILPLPHCLVPEEAGDAFHAMIGGAASLVRNITKRYEA